MRSAGGAVAGWAFGLVLALSVAAAIGGQSPGLVGYLPKDRVVELAAAADGSLASYTPSPAALASFAALIDPVHLRVFLCASRPADLAFAARVARSVEAAANPVFSAEFVGVAADLSEPAGLLSENAVTAAPGRRVEWQTAFHLATAGGAKALDLAIGTFLEGHHFDAIVIDTNISEGTIRLFDQAAEYEQILARIIYTASKPNIMLTIVDGISIA